MSLPVIQRLQLRLLSMIGVLRADYPDNWHTGAEQDSLVRMAQQWWARRGERDGPVLHAAPTEPLSGLGPNTAAIPPTPALGHDLRDTSRPGITTPLRGMRPSVPLRRATAAVGRPTAKVTARQRTLHDMLTPSVATKVSRCNGARGERDGEPPDALSIIHISEPTRPY